MLNIRAPHLSPPPVRDMDIVHQGKAGIEGARECTRPQLHCGDKAISVNVIQHALGNGLLQEFGEALQEGNRM